MGRQELSFAADGESYRRHTHGVLEDLQALERMLAEQRFEREPVRFGAEQEMFLVDENMVPARAALRVLERLQGLPFTQELGLFNIEANLTPHELKGAGLRDMALELEHLLAAARAAARSEGLEILLTGILPTLEEADLDEAAMTPSPRYQQLNELLRHLRGDDFRTFIRGPDLLEITCGNVMLEACNTSFQVHLQVDPADFVPLYNAAQLVTAPVLAAAANSPLLFGHRLWHETRIALLQQSLDTRTRIPGRRNTRQRVSFGERWVEHSVVELYREDLARFQILITLPERESPLAVLDRGECPDLEGLALHNGTVYRWNRPCYGVANGKAHLRIENRVLPSGPTAKDEIANAAFFLGLVHGVRAELGDPAKHIPFDVARTNFHAAARYGLGARLEWHGGERLGADELVLRILPLARRGLLECGVDEDDVADYSGIIEERVRCRRTGAQWVLDHFEKERNPSGSAASRSLTRRLLELQLSGAPVHTWPKPESLAPTLDRESARTVGRIMSSDLFTVRPEDSVELAASVMDWRRLRHLPVEDATGRLVGLLTHRGLLRLLSRRKRGELPTLAVSDVMIREPATVSPETPTTAALERMRRDQLGCLPVVRDGRLVGIITERDFIDLSARLLEAWLPS